jgi:hypothetical protein
MKDKLSIHKENLDSHIKLFQIVDKCAKYEERHMFLCARETSSTVPRSKAKPKEQKRKEPVVLA